MSKINHRRKNPDPSYGKRRTIYERVPKNPRFDYAKTHCFEQDEDTITYAEEQTEKPLKNGFLRKHGTHLDKSMHGAGCTSLFVDRSFGSIIGTNFSNGHRGMAKAMRGAKKYVRSRFRFHEKAQTQKLMRDAALIEDE